MQRKFLPIVFLVFAFSFSYQRIFSQVLLGSPPYNQDFNTLSNSVDNTPVSSPLPPMGWLFLETSTNANAEYRPHTGSGNAGDTYSFGATGNTERAFGQVRSGGLISTIGANFQNDTGSPLTSISIQYYGEQWRLGATGRNDKMDFQYSLNATSLSTGTWIDVNDLDFIAPIAAGTVGALNGNDAANRVNISYTINGLTVANGSTFWIRWNDVDASGADDGLAIDDFQLSYPVGDITPPSFPRGYPNIFNFTTSGFDLIYRLNESGKVYYVILPKDATTPTALQVKEGKDASDNSLTTDFKGNVVISSGASEFTSTISTLNQATEYDVYIVAEDDASNLQDNPWKLTARTNTTGDITPPTFTTSYPSIPSVSSFGFNMYTALNEWGTAYFVILNHDATPPTSQQVTQGKDAAGNTLAEELSGSTIINRVDDEFLYKVDELTPGTTYDVYVVAEDNVPNLQSTPVKLTITTKPFFEELFEECERGSFTSYSVAGAQTWGCVDFGRASKGYRMNGFSGSAIANEDWLISPPLQIGTSAKLSFYSQFSFAGSSLQLKISTDYVGEGNPTAATWTILDGQFPTVAVASTSSSLSDWTSSEVDLSAYAGQKVYIAYVYTSTSSAAARWTIDDINVTNATASYLSLSTSGLNFSADGSVKNYTLKGFGLSNNVSLTVSGDYSLSKDNSSFTNTLSFTSAEVTANATVYVKFSPSGLGTDTYAGSISHISTGVAPRTISLIGTDKSKTFDVTAFNLEFFGTDIRGTDGSEFGPTDDALQVSNAITVFQTIQSDIFSVEEVSDDNAMNQLVAGLPGYAKVMADRWSYSFNPPDPNFPPQKIGFVYNTSTVNVINSRVMFAKMYDDIRAGSVTLPSYPGAGSSSFWSSGRLPFMITADVTINEKVVRVKMISLHSKSGSAQEDYNRRKYDVQVLYDSLMAHYPDDKIIILGDFNDNVIGSINVGSESTYKVFVDDQTNFKALTYDLSQNGGYTFPSSSSFLDHIIISNELFEDYVPNSILIDDPRTYISNYSNTTSDHLPVSARFVLSNKQQSITFTVSSPKTFGDLPFDLNATSTSGLPVTFVSSDPSILSITGNKATILKGGSVKITASQTGNATYEAATNVVVDLVVNKANQTISFLPVADKIAGDNSFALQATTDSKLPIKFTTVSDHISIDGNDVTLINAGRVIIKAEQAGNESYQAASTTQSFCIKPAKPTITTSNSSLESQTLISSSSIGNQWYLNDNAITNGTNSTLTTSSSGIFKVQVTVDDCVSEFSGNISIVITALEDEDRISFYPNPASDYLIVSGIKTEMSMIMITDMSGRSISLPAERMDDNQRKIDIQSLSKGMYLLRLIEEQNVRQLKFVKN